MVATDVVGTVHRCEAQYNCMWRGGVPKCGCFYGPAFGRPAFGGVSPATGEHGNVYGDALDGSEL